MTQPFHRRGFFRSLVAALLGGGAAHAADSRADSDSGTVVYEAHGLPPGLSLDSHTGVIAQVINNNTTVTKHTFRRRVG